MENRVLVHSLEVPNTWRVTGSGPHSEEWEVQTRFLSEVTALAAQGGQLCIQLADSSAQVPSLPGQPLPLQAKKKKVFSLPDLPQFCCPRAKVFYGILVLG